MRVHFSKNGRKVIGAIHKKQSKNFIKNYRPKSLLPILNKVFERLVFNTLFNFIL